METIGTLFTMLGGLALSVGCGLMLEELIFGGLVRLFFASQRVAGSEGSERNKRDGGK
jgi:hypothetical protein